MPKKPKKIRPRPILLVVDDEDPVRRATVRVLTAQLDDDIVVEQAASAQEALAFLTAHFKKHPEVRVFIFSDNNMLATAKPGDTVQLGVELLKEARERFGIRVFTCLVTGDSNVPQSEYIDDTFGKPFNDKKVIQAFRCFERMT